MTSFLDANQWGEILDTLAPFIDTAKQRRQVIKTFLPDMLDTGYSGHKALEIFKTSKLGVSNRTFYDIRRGILKDTNLTSALRLLPDDEIVSDSMMRISSYPLHRRYLYVASYMMEDKRTGLTRWGEYAIDTDFRGQKSDILQLIIKELREKYPEGNFDFSAVNLRRAYINLK